jgi:hypothetical protein
VIDDVDSFFTKFKDNSLVYGLPAKKEDDLMI